MAKKTAVRWKNVDFLKDLLTRLDAALERAWEEQEFVDEING